MTTIRNEAQALGETLVQHRRYLHAHAEIGMDLPVTTAYVLEKLRALGYEPEEIAPCAIVAVAGKAPGRTVLLRADTDALPISEETGLAFASKENMHACGHDLHTASLLGVAELLKRHESELRGQVKLMFQPAEETLGGAPAMLAAGVLKNPDVDAALAAHTMMRPAGEPATLTPGYALASSDHFTLTVRGRGGHGSAPENAVDPIACAVQIHLGLQELKAREIPAREPVSLTVGSFNAGTADNIIPSEAVLAGTLRTYNNALRDALLARIEEISVAIGAAYRCEVDAEIRRGTPPLYNDPALCELLAARVGAALGDGALALSEERQMASEDFGFVSEAVPSAYFFVPSKRPEPEYDYPHHHQRIDFSEDALVNFTALMTTAAIEYLRAE